MELMTLKQVSEYLTLSRSTIYRLIAAREFDDEIKAGRKDASDAPKAIRRLLGMNFPKKYLLSVRSVRFNKEEIYEWARMKWAIEAEAKNSKNQT